MATLKVQQVAVSKHCASISVALEESRVELDSGVVVGELVAKSEAVRKLKMNRGVLVAELDARVMLVAELTQQEKGKFAR